MVTEKEMKIQMNLDETLQNPEALKQAQADGLFGTPADGSELSVKLIKRGMMTPTEALKLKAATAFGAQPEI